MCEAIPLLPLCAFMAYKVTNLFTWCVIRLFVADYNHSVYRVVFQRGEWSNIFYYSTNVTVFRLLGLHDHHTRHPYQLRPGS
jgi:hypothetical protein